MSMVKVDLRDETFRKEKEKRARVDTLEAAVAALDKVPDVPPDPGDELPDSWTPEHDARLRRSLQRKIEQERAERARRNG